MELKELEQKYNRLQEQREAIRVTIKRYENMIKKLEKDENQIFAEQIEIGDKIDKFSLFGGTYDTERKNIKIH